MNLKIKLTSIIILIQLTALSLFAQDIVIGAEDIIIYERETHTTGNFASPYNKPTPQHVRNLMINFLGSHTASSINSSLPNNVLQNQIDSWANSVNSLRLQGAAAGWNQFTSPTTTLMLTENMTSSHYPADMSDTLIRGQVSPYDNFFGAQQGMLRVAVHGETLKPPSYYDNPNNPVLYDELDDGNRRYFTTAQLANFIQNSGHWTPGQPIILNTCGGALQCSPNSITIAENLSNLLNTPVMSPDGSPNHMSMVMVRNGNEYAVNNPSNSPHPGAFQSYPELDENLTRTPGNGIVSVTTVVSKHAGNISLEVALGLTTAAGIAMVLADYDPDVAKDIFINQVSQIVPSMVNSIQTKPLETLTEFAAWGIGSYVVGGPVTLAYAATMTPLAVREAIDQQQYQDRVIQAWNNIQERVNSGELTEEQGARIFLMVTRPTSIPQMRVVERLAIGNTELAIAMGNQISSVTEKNNYRQSLADAIQDSIDNNEYHFSQEAFDAETDHVMAVAGVIAERRREQFLSNMAARADNRITQYDEIVSQRDSFMDSIKDAKELVDRSMDVLRYNYNTADIPTVTIDLDAEYDAVNEELSSDLEESTIEDLASRLDAQNQALADAIKDKVDSDPELRDFLLSPGQHSFKVDINDSHSTMTTPMMFAGAGGLAAGQEFINRFFQEFAGIDIERGMVIHVDEGAGGDPLPRVTSSTLVAEINAAINELLNGGGSSSGGSSGGGSSGGGSTGPSPEEIACVGSGGNWIGAPHNICIHDPMF